MLAYLYMYVTVNAPSLHFLTIHLYVQRNFRFRFLIFPLPLWLCGFIFWFIWYKKYEKENVTQAKYALYCRKQIVRQPRSANYTLIVPLTTKQITFLFFNFYEII